MTIITLGLKAQTDSVAFSPNELWIKSIRHELDSLAQKVDKQKWTAGICVMDLTDDSVVFRYNADKMLKPASTQKLFVATAALQNLGADYQFKTYLNVDGNIEEDSIGRRFLNGNICICGSFDPTLKLSNVDYLSSKIALLGVDSVAGNIVVDNRVKMNVERVKDEQKYFAENMYRNLCSMGVKFSSSMPYVTSPVPVETGWSLAVMTTPIDSVLKKMLKNSNNTYAECMLLNLCDMGRNDGWTYDGCRHKVMDMVGTLGCGFDSYIIIDGSGLSHNNRCTADLLVKLLRNVYHDEKVYPSIYANLPIAGEDGTLSKRMKTGYAYNNVRAKTGTLNAVTTLSGFVNASNGHKMAFAVMCNDIWGAAAGKSLQDSVCQLLAK